MKSCKRKYCKSCGGLRTEVNTDVMSHGYFRSKCKVCFKVSSKQYEKTYEGYLVRSYRNMKSRVSGVLKEKRHLYEGKEICKKEEFYAWSKQDTSYRLLFDRWVENSYNVRLSPSVDRIDPCLGYIEGNMRWVTHDVNSLLGLYSKIGKHITLEDAIAICEENLRRSLL